MSSQVLSQKSPTVFLNSCCPITVTKTKINIGIRGGNSQKQSKTSSKKGSKISSQIAEGEKVISKTLEVRLRELQKPERLVAPSRSFTSGFTINEPDIRASYHSANHNTGRDPLEKRRQGLFSGAKSRNRSPDETKKRPTSYHASV